MENGNFIALNPKAKTLIPIVIQWNTKTFIHFELNQFGCDNAVTSNNLLLFVRLG
jgi:hypothetical protein